MWVIGMQERHSLYFACIRTAEVVVVGRTRNLSGHWWLTVPVAQPAIIMVPPLLFFIRFHCFCSRGYLYKFLHSFCFLRVGGILMESIPVAVCKTIVGRSRDNGKMFFRPSDYSGWQESYCSSDDWVIIEPSDVNNYWFNMLFIMLSKYSEGRRKKWNMVKLSSAEIFLPKAGI